MPGIRYNCRVYEFLPVSHGPATGQACRLRLCGLSTNHLINNQTDQSAASLTIAPTAYLAGMIASTAASIETAATQAFVRPGSLHACRLLTLSRMALYE